MNEIKTAIILAAGRGIRASEVTKETNKCMLPYKGQPLLERVRKGGLAPSPEVLKAAVVSWFL